MSVVGFKENECLTLLKRKPAYKAEMEEKVLCIWKYSMVVFVSLNAANLHGFFFFLNLYSRAKCLRYR